ncbi:MAG: hypothetical protein B6226_02005 [Candidatus Cloacimonetes bacterium 4572_65]|nr:MAG: hypothetical protein B6226_02005 [Candidatus Cloacimonetes bacterium 4572_65]
MKELNPKFSAGSKSDEGKRKSHKRLTKPKERVQIRNTFNRSIKEIKDRLTMKPTDDYLRAEIVSLISAMDYYFHEIFCACVIEIFNHERLFDTEKTDKSVLKNLYRHKISLEYVRRFYDNKEDLSSIVDGVYSSIGYYSYQKYSKIKELLQCITNYKELEAELMQNLVCNKKNLTLKLNDITNRRNNIAHRSDYNIETYKKETISKEYVEESVSFIEEFIKTIDDYLNNN